MTLDGKERIVITGCGWVSPLARGGVTDVLSHTAGELQAGPDGYAAVPDEYREGCENLTSELKQDKSSWMAALALEHACRQAGLSPTADDGTAVGLVFGCALAGQLGMLRFADEVREQSPRFVSPLHFPQTVGNYPAGALARAYGIRGPNVTLAGGVASGLDAIVEAHRLLAAGRADVVIAGGCDQLSAALAAAMDMNGQTLSEGACLFVLERGESARDRGVRVLAESMSAASGACGGDLPDNIAAEPVLSVASTKATTWNRPDVIVIDSLIGQCMGALSAAAMAAVIGNASGLAVPRADGVSVATAGKEQAVVFADAPGHHRTLVRLALPA